MFSRHHWTALVFIDDKEGERIFPFAMVRGTSLGVQNGLLNVPRMFFSYVEIVHFSFSREKLVRSNCGFFTSASFYG